MEGSDVSSMVAGEDLARSPDLRIRALTALVDSGAFDVLSLDVFDTLVWRGVPRPSDAFLLMAKRFRVRGWLGPGVSDASFACARQGAEDRARREVTGHEVGLAAIWEAFPRGFVESGTSTEWMAEELELERELIRPYPAMVELALRAQARGMRLALVSDTYFSSGFLLECTGLSPELVLASCEQGVSKSLGLHRILLERLGVEPARVLHVGDHPVADVESARRIGLAACPFPKVPEELADALAEELPRTLESRASLLVEEDHGWTSLRGRVMAESEDAHEVWGAGVLGPVLTGFADWVAERSRAIEAVSVWCLMREGRLLRGLLAETHSEIPAHECFVSRYVALRAAVGEAGEEDLAAFLRRPSPTPIGRLLAQLGLPLDAVPGLDAAALVEPRQARSLARRLARDPGLRRRIRESCGVAREGLLAHLDTLGAARHQGTIAVADLGYTGTIQGALHRLLAAERPRIRLHGLYLVTGGHVHLTQHAGARLEGWLAHNSQPIRVSHTFMRSPEVVEQSMMADCGTTVGHEPDGTPVLEERAIPPDQAAAIRSVQGGILRFARAWRAHRSLHGAPSAETVRSLAQGVIVRAVARPSAPELEWFGGWVHDENLGSERLRTLTEPVSLNRWELEHMSAHQLASLPSSQLYWPCGLAHQRSRALGAALAALFLRTSGPEAFDSCSAPRPLAFYWDTGEGFHAEQARLEPLSLASHGRAWKRFSMHVEGETHHRYAFSLGFPGELVRWAGIRVTVEDRDGTHHHEFAAEALEVSGMERLEGGWWVVRQDPPLVATPQLPLTTFDGRVHVDAFVTVASP